MRCLGSLDRMQIDHLKRREFLTLLGGAATAWPFAAGAQQTMPVVGLISVGSPDAYEPYLAAFRRGLNETGYTEGRNVAIDYRWAEGEFNRLPALAADLVKRQVNVIAAGASTLIAKAATATIPIVGMSSGDPVRSGLVASLNRPGGNVTAVGLFTFSLGPKRFELLRELVPNANAIAVLANPSDPDPEAETDLKGVETAARTVGQQLCIVNASSEHDFEPAFATMTQQGAGALLVMADPFFNSRRTQLVELAARHAIPAIYEWREFAAVGGLMSYGSSLPDGYRQMGIYAGKLLAGASPADLPVFQAVKIELVINTKTAKTLGVTFPITLLGRADEAIE
jgi:putative ABC transport system substrate-binding protein